jgi:branched-chain amino acid transport system ATP-binding protein
VVDAIFAFIERVAADGVSLLMVEQYIGRALALADVVYLLNQGSIVYSGSAGDLDEERVFAYYAGEDATGQA